jgi:hypothetical protein
LSNIVWGGNLDHHDMLPYNCSLARGLISRRSEEECSHESASYLTGQLIVSDGGIALLSKRPRPHFIAEVKQPN